MLKIASRTFAAVGRVCAPRGALSRRPRSDPPVSLITALLLPRGSLQVKSEPTGRFLRDVTLVAAAHTGELPVGKTKIINVA